MGQAQILNNILNCEETEKNAKFIIKDVSSIYSRRSAG